MYDNRLFGLNIYTDGIMRLVSDIKDGSSKIHIISGNADVLKYPLRDKDTYDLFSDEKNVIIPDGISVYYPMRIKNKKCYKIPGVDLMEKLIFEFQDTGKPVYFLGAKENIINEMIQRFKILYPALKIVGYHHGYFDKDNCNDIIAKIKNSQAYALFVAFGAPSQENFIFTYMNELPCSVFMGVGGSFDVLSGTVRRSPKWMRYLSIEWLYRLIVDPSKIGRVLNNFKFTINAFMKG